jgi:hypothetical protein
VLHELDGEVSSTTLAPSLDAEGVTAANFRDRQRYTGVISCHIPSGIDVDRRNVSILTRSARDEYFVEMGIAAAALGAQQSAVLSEQKWLSHQNSPFRHVPPAPAGGSATRLQPARVLRPEKALPVQLPLKHAY